MRPKLYYVDSTRNSITLRWEINRELTDLLFRVEVKDSVYGWITKYCGQKMKCEIKDLGPERLYYFRLGVSSGSKEEIWSETLTTATRDAPPMMFYLIKSAERGDIKGLDSFFAERKDSAVLDGFDNRGATALIKGAERGDVGVTKRLIKAGASVNQGGYITDRTPLMYASFKGHADVALVLLENGADVNLTDCNNCAAVHYAVDADRLDLVRLCLEYGADVNLKDSIGWTPLMRAVIHNSSESVVRELITHGSEIKAKDRNGKMALDLAEINKNQKIIEVLMECHVKGEDTDVTIEKEFEKKSGEDNGIAKECEEEQVEDNKCLLGTNDQPDTA